MNHSMAIEIQRTGIRLMVVGIRCLGDNLDTKTAHSHQWKTTKIPQGLWKALQMDKSLETTSTQRKDFGLMAVS